MSGIPSVACRSLRRADRPRFLYSPLSVRLHAAPLSGDPNERHREVLGIPKGLSQHTPSRQRGPHGCCQRQSFVGVAHGGPFNKETNRGRSINWRPLYVSSCLLHPSISNSFPTVLAAADRRPSFPAIVGYSRQSVRFKMVKSSSYHRRSRASPTGQTQKAHVGPRRLAAEYVTPGALLVKQRRHIAWGFENKRRNRHKKMYPGENVGVAKDSSLVALVHGRVKYTHDTERDVMLCNVLPEPREELLREDLWRYRTEHVASKEENRQVCYLRTKATRVFGKQLVNPPTKPLPRPKKLSKYDMWENPTLPDAPPLCEDR